MTCRLRRPVLATLFLVLSSCSSSQTLPPLDVDEGCQPLLAGSECLLPFPSDFFLVADDALPSGARVEIAGLARLETDSGETATLGDWRPADGASRLAMPTATLGVALKKEGVVGYFDDPERTLRPDSRTLVIEARTGRFIPHFTDLDPRAEAPERQAIIVHPLGPLEARTRYVVALQRLESEEGGTAPAPEGFRRLRDGEAAGDKVLEPLSKRYEKNVFPVLDAAGVSRADLQLAWDFTTGSDEHTEADMLRVRALTVEWMRGRALDVTVDSVTTSPSDGAWRIVEGHYEVPNFLNGDTLSRGADGRVAQNGTTRAPFSAVVPDILRTRPGAGVSLGYGHGAFGSREEILSDHPKQMANRTRAVMYATDWVGMSRADAVKVVGAVGTEPSRALVFADRVPQAMANWIVLSAVVAGPLRQLEAFQNDAGEPLYPPEASRFVGISQGHILGGVLAAVHPALTRVALLSGGAAFSHMLSRSNPLTAFFFLLDMESQYDRRRFESTLQPYFDRIDGAFWARRVFEKPLENARERRVLMQIGLGDVEVPNIGAFIHARALGLPLLEPSPMPVSGLDTVEAPATSALSLFDLRVDLNEVYELAQPHGKENRVHEGMRRLSGAMSQLESFFGPADEIAHFCDGACDPN